MANPAITTTDLKSWVETIAKIKFNMTPSIISQLAGQLAANEDAMYVLTTVVKELGLAKADEHAEAKLPSELENFSINEEMTDALSYSLQDKNFIQEAQEAVEQIRNDDAALAALQTVVANTDANKAPPDQNLPNEWKNNDDAPDEFAATIGSREIEKVVEALIDAVEAAEATEATAAINSVPRPPPRPPPPKQAAIAIANAPKDKKELQAWLIEYHCGKGWTINCGQPKNGDKLTHGHPNTWDVSQITDMSSLFYTEELTDFNEDISAWDVSNVKKMNRMFCCAKSFNQNINTWNVFNVKTMQLMFCEADSFNQPIGNWDVSNVRSMKGMFKEADDFNQPIGNWSVQNVQ